MNASASRNSTPASRKPARVSKKVRAAAEQNQPLTKAGLLAAVRTANAEITFSEGNYTHRVFTAPNGKIRYEDNHAMNTTLTTPEVAVKWLLEIASAHQFTITLR